MIGELATLQRLEWHQFANRMKGAFKNHPVMALLMTLGAGGFYYGYLKLAWMLTTFIYGQEVYGAILANKLILILLFISMGVAVMSALTTSIAQLYISKDLEFQFSLPVTFKSWFTHRFGQIFLQSNWMLLAFGAPFIWMYLTLGETPLVARALGLVAFMMVCAFPVIAAVLACVCLVRVFPARRIHQVFLVFSVVLASSVVVIFRYLEPEQFIGPGGIERFRGYVDLVNVEGQAWNPAVWASNLLTALMLSEWGEAWRHGSRLVIVFFAANGLLYLAAAKLYRSSWDRALQALSGEDHGQDQKKERFLAVGLSNFRLSQECRELLLFIRDPSQWSQVFVLISLLVLYLISLQKIPENPFGGSRYHLALGNTGFVGFICLSIANRFVFTSFSADGQALWLMKTAPDGWLKFVRSKMLVYGLPAVVFAEVLCLLSAWILDMDAAQTRALVIYCFWDSVLIVLMSLGFGMVFINPGIENPLKLIVSPGGFLMLALGSFLVGLHVFMRLATNSYMVNTLLGHIGWPDMEDAKVYPYYAGLIILESAIVFYLLKRGLTHLRKGEYV